MKRLVIKLTLTIWLTDQPSSLIKKSDQNRALQNKNQYSNCKLSEMKKETGSRPKLTPETIANIVEQKRRQSQDGLKFLMFS